MLSKLFPDWRLYLEPAGMTRERETDQIPFDSISRSYFLMRTLVGCLGLALPAALLLGEYFFLADEFTARGSLSAYYHSGMRDVFVSILAVVGILLVTYKISEKNRDNALSVLAGIAAIGVALFPTGIPSDVDAELTPFQERLGEGTTEFIHYSCAAVFIVSLLFLCIDFAKRERGRRRDRAGKVARRSP
jgi:cytochrome bd-type quinol oxidase subunit 2